MAVKLPLAARKNFRDDYESVAGKLQERLKAVTDEDYTLDPNAEGMFAAAEGTDRAVQLGSMLYSYLDNTIRGIEDLTKKGKDAEAVQVFNSLVPNRKIVVISDKELFRYCGTRFQDGDYQIVIHPEQLWVASNSINEYLTRVIDMEQWKSKGELPLSVRRAEKERLLSATEKASAKFKKFFKKDYTFEYDLLSIYKAYYEATASEEALEKERIDEKEWFRRYGSGFIPNVLSQHFENLVSELEQNKFGSDDMLQEAFVDAIETGVVAFRLVPELKAGYYRDAEFDGGKLYVITTVKTFSNVSFEDMGKKIIDKL